ncbi:uncharacterized protein [Euphorbia lathyris]|uniref:uncharacterized protein isoform X3 n=1 Tax=Euphorbia lathyris TaxID=212925 RepID=UPI003313FB99
MTSSISYSIDDKDLDDAALWAVIDSAEASHSSSKSRKPLALKYPNFRSPPIPISSFSPPSKLPQNPKSQFKNNSPVSDPYRRPHKLARTCGSEVGDITSPLALVRTPIVNTAAYSSPEAYLSPQIGRYSESELNNGSEVSPLIYMRSEEKDVTSHCLNGRFPSVSLFKDYQNAAMAVGGRYHFTSMFLMKSKTGPLNLMITEMSNALNLLYEHTCRVAGFLMDGVHVSVVKRDFKSQIMIFLVQLKLEQKTEPARTCLELENIDLV